MVDGRNSKFRIKKVRIFPWRGFKSLVEIDENSMPHVSLH